MLMTGLSIEPDVKDLLFLPSIVSLDSVLGGRI